MKRLNEFINEGTREEDLMADAKKRGDAKKQEFKKWGKPKKSGDVAQYIRKLPNIHDDEYAKDVANHLINVYKMKAGAILVNFSQWRTKKETDRMRSAISSLESIEYD